MDVSKLYDKFKKDWRSLSDQEENFLLKYHNELTDDEVKILATGGIDELIEMMNELTELIKTGRRLDGKVS